MSLRDEGELLTQVAENIQEPEPENTQGFVEESGEISQQKLKPKSVISIVDFYIFTQGRL